MISRTLILAVTALACTVASPTMSAQATYPTKPVTMVVGFAAGSATDIVARVVGQKLSERLGQPVLIQNVVGAASNIASESVTRAPADGYTLLMVSGAIAIGPAVSNLKYDVERDLTPIGSVGYLPTVLLVNEAVPVTTFAEFVEYAKKRPGKLNYGSSGTGGSTHMAAELLSQAVGIKMTHIPYKGNAPAGAGVMAGDIEVLIDTVLLASQSLKTNKVKALAATGKTRSPVLPNVPTFSEVGLPDFDASIFFGVMGPANLPKPIVDKLNKELNEVIGDADVKAKLGTTGGLQLSGGTAAQFGTMIHNEVVKWKRVSKATGIRAE